MANYENHGLKETKNSFQLRGIVTGTKKSSFYNSGFGSNKNGVSVNFGVEINHNKTVFLSLTGYPRKTVNYYKRGENGAKGINKQVPWDSRHNVPGDGFNLIGTRITTGVDEDGANVNETFIEYDAVNWLHENLKDGDQVFIRGTIEYSSYVKNGQTVKRISLVPNQISKARVNFESEDYVEMCEFESNFVFDSIEKEMNDRGSASGRYLLNGYYIDYRSVEPITYVIDENHAKLAANLKKAMSTGNAIKVYGRVNVVNDIVTEDEDDGWGEASPMEKVNGPVVREYMVYKASPATIDKETWTEDGIVAAMRKLKAAKEARSNFGDKPVVDETESWDIADDEDVPW